MTNNLLIIKGELHYLVDRVNKEALSFSSFGEFKEQVDFDMALTNSMGGSVNDCKILSLLGKGRDYVDICFDYKRCILEKSSVISLQSKLTKVLPCVSILPYRMQWQGIKGIQQIFIACKPELTVELLEEVLNVGKLKWLPLEN